MEDYLFYITGWTFLEIPSLRWISAFVAVLATFMLQKFLLRRIHGFASYVAHKTETLMDDLLFEAAEKPLGWLMMIIGFLIALQLLNAPEDRFPIVSVLFEGGRIFCLVIGAWFVWRLIDGLTVFILAHEKETKSALNGQLIPFLAKTFKVFLVLTVLLVVAQNMGYSISGLVASLGIGGIAVAMAAKDTIANVFGSIMLLIDRPFVIGNWIKTSEFEGVVEEIGFRSTRIRTFAKTLVNVPNSSLANMVIDNIDAMPRRRVKMRIGITYSTTAAQMEQAVAGIEEILRQHPGVDQEFSLVKFDEFEESSLSIFLYYFTQSTNWSEYLQVRQEVNLQMMALLESLQLEFAFPTRTLHIEPQHAPLSS